MCLCVASSGLSPDDTGGLNLDLRCSLARKPQPGLPPRRVVVIVSDEPGQDYLYYNEPPTGDTHRGPRSLTECLPSGHAFDNPSAAALRHMSRRRHSSPHSVATKIPKTSHFNYVRLGVLFLVGLLACSEYYEYCSNPSCERLGQNLWLILAILQVRLQPPLAPGG